MLALVNTLLITRPFPDVAFPSWLKLWKCFSLRGRIVQDLLWQNEAFPPTANSARHAMYNPHKTNTFIMCQIPGQTWCLGERQREKAGRERSLVWQNDNSQCQKLSKKMWSWKHMQPQDFTAHVSTTATGQKNEQLGQQRFTVSHQMFDCFFMVNHLISNF